jgi:hypothetical protein
LYEKIIDNIIAEVNATHREPKKKIIKKAH